MAPSNAQPTGSRDPRVPEDMRYFWEDSRDPATQEGVQIGPDNVGDTTLSHGDVITVRNDDPSTDWVGSIESIKTWSPDNRRDHFTVPANTRAFRMILVWWMRPAKTDGRTIVRHPANPQRVPSRYWVQEKSNRKGWRICVIHAEAVTGRLEQDMPLVGGRYVVGVYGYDEGADYRALRDGGCRR